MKFLVDANLPYKLAKSLKERGFDTIHTDDLPDKERTTDREIRRVCKNENRIIITKDTDFLDSHVVQGIPVKLLLITTGNIINRDLLILIEKYFEEVVKLFKIYDLVEIGNDEIITHEK